MWFKLQGLTIKREIDGIPHFGSGPQPIFFYKNRFLILIFS